MSDLEQSFFWRVGELAEVAPYDDSFEPLATEEEAVSNSKQSPVFYLQEEGKLDPLQSCMNCNIKFKCRQELFQLAPQSSLGSGEKRPLV